MINWEKFLFIPRSALGHFPLTFLCSEISGGTLHLSVPLVQPRPSDERCDGQIVMVLAFCGTVNIAARARIRSTSLFTSWNCQSDLWRIISLLHDSSGTISIDWPLSLRSKEYSPPTKWLKWTANIHLVLFAEVGHGRANFNEIYIIWLSNEAK